ncbi:hypothetical protein [Hyphomicrobium sp. MC1]|uniref:hypothetical protein n=1 Tax=Hyphomicrobium sp. (strain MC1) TaxID=717785 RepID=UPI000213DA86|nr:hypothetical protein [Hyphomicrobium sp. MC1]CCB64427.1 protein of unknown function [Hyphomicrobium sp. MC1]
MLDLRTERPECFDLGTTHLSKQSNGWKWDGEDRWWNVFTTINGYNGAGGYWVTDEWRWNNSSETIRTDIRSLSFDESRALEADIVRLMTERKGLTSDNPTS